MNREMLKKGIRNPNKIIPFLKRRTANIFYNFYEWKGFWKVWLNRAGVISKPYRISLRNKSPPLYAGWRDRGVIKEFYQEDGYSDLNLSEFDTVIDIGAHIGLFTIHASDAGATVYSFEPARDSYLNMVNNIEANSGSDSKIIAHNFAVTDRNGYCEFNQNPKSSLVDSTALDRGEETVTVPCFSFSTIADTIQAEGETLLKLDCEGAEFGIIESSSTEDFRQIDTVLLEYHGEAGDPEEIEQTLTDYGFAVSRREDPRTDVPYDLGFILAESNKQ